MRIHQIELLTTMDLHPVCYVLAVLLALMLFLYLKQN